MIFHDLYLRGLSDPLLQQIPLHELQCYNLPFGALGFTSHVLTYYTIVCLWFGRKPLWPFSNICYTKFDVLLGSLGIVICVAMSAITMVRCRNTWQLLVIAVWKLSMSLLNGLTALHVAILVVLHPEGEAKDSKTAAWWILLYVPGMMAGVIGLMSLVGKVATHSHPLLSLTVSFYLIIGASSIVSFISTIVIYYRRGDVPGNYIKGGFALTIAFFLVLSALYADWCLGIMLDNIVGVPSGDKSILYWTYFVAKRLTMFSW